MSDNQKPELVYVPGSMRTVSDKPVALRWLGGKLQYARQWTDGPAGGIEWVDVPVEPAEPAPADPGCWNDDPLYASWGVYMHLRADLQGAVGLARAHRFDAGSEAWVQFITSRLLHLATVRGKLAGDAAGIAQPLEAHGQSRPPCTVCGKPYAEHGTYPTCATHPYTADSRCGASGTLEHGKFVGHQCPGAACRNGCVRGGTPLALEAPMDAEQWERRQGIRARDGWVWSTWQLCDEAEARRVDGLQSWQVRRVCVCETCGGTGRMPAGVAIPFNGQEN